MTLSMVVEHLSMVVFAIVIAILIGVPLGLLCYLSRAARGVVLRVVDLIQTTPALALLGIIMVTPLGAGKPTVILGLALYSLLPIVRNVTLGLSQVSPAVKEAAKGMGMTRVYSLFHVELPLAMPMLFTGLRIAVVNAIGTAVFASSVGGGGLGNLINTGIRRNDVAMILSGTAALMAMALLLDGEPQFLICPGGLILNTDKVSRVEGRVVALENEKRLMVEEPAVRELQARRAVRLSHMQAQTV